MKDRRKSGKLVANISVSKVFYHEGKITDMDMHVKIYFLGWRTRAQHPWALEPDRSGLKPVLSTTDARPSIHIPIPGAYYPTHPRRAFLLILCAQPC